MKYVFKTLVLIICIAACLSSCSRSYGPNDAKERGDIVDLHGTITNLDRLNIFITNIEAQKKDNIRLTRYTIEGDPIYYDFTYNGSNIKYKYDNSNDNFGKGNVRTTVCKKMIKTIEEPIVEYKLEECSGDNAEIGNQFSFKIKP